MEKNFIVGGIDWEVRRAVEAKRAVTPAELVLYLYEFDNEVEALPFTVEVAEENPNKMKKYHFCGKKMAYG